MNEYTTTVNPPADLFSAAELALIAADEQAQADYREDREAQTAPF